MRYKARQVQKKVKLGITTRTINVFCCLMFDQNYLDRMLG